MSSRSNCIFCRVLLGAAFAASVAGAEPSAPRSPDSLRADVIRSSAALGASAGYCPGAARRRCAADSPNQARPATGASRTVTRAYRTMVWSGSADALAR